METENNKEFTVVSKIIIIFLVILVTFLLKNVQSMSILFIGLVINFIFQKKRNILFIYIPIYLVLSIIRWLNHMNLFPIVVFSEFYMFLFWWLTPIFMAMHDLMTTSSGKISAFLSKISATKMFILGVLVICRFVPTVKHSIKGVRESMHNRRITSIRTLIFHPIRSYEYILIPMLMSSLTVADQLSASAIVRGIEAPYKRGSYYEDKIGWKDCFGVTVILFIFCYVLF